MARYISSVVVTLSPKREFSSESLVPLVSKVLELDFVSGATIPQATHFINKSPLIKPYFSNYSIVCLIFNYSDL